jgi:glycerol-3-phosphate acyltransferase PlsX
MGPVAVDIESGDFAPDAIVAGLVLARAHGVPVVAVGRLSLRRLLPDAVALPWVEATPVALAHAGEVRHHPELPVRRALAEVVAGRASAAVSFGNSAATLVASVLDLGLIAGVERPAIAAVLPRADGGSLVVLDAGASVDARPEHLPAFALLGDAYARVLGVARPRVGLLSNGTEASKGNRLVRAADPLLAALTPTGIDYRGQVEPHSALVGAVDVLVCDGFSGNILLKTAEGTVEVVRAALEGMRPGGAGVGIGEDPAASPWGARLDWRSQGGALLLGVRAPVVMGHGRADAEAVCAAVRRAHYAAERGLVGDVASRMPALASVPPRVEDDG